VIESLEVGAALYHGEASCICCILNERVLATFSPIKVLKKKFCILRDAEASETLLIFTLPEEDV